MAGWELDPGPQVIKAPILYPQFCSYYGEATWGKLAGASETRLGPLGGHLRSTSLPGQARRSAERAFSESNFQLLVGHDSAYAQVFRGRRSHSCQQEIAPLGRNWPGPLGEKLQVP